MFRWFRSLLGSRSNSKYARMGVEDALQLSPRRWKKALASGQGLFEQHRVSGVIGPQYMPEKNDIKGDMFSTETMQFAQVATDDQQKLADRLAEEDMQRYYHYILHVIQGLKIWKEDIKNLEEIDRFLKSMEKVLDEEKHLEERELKYYSKAKRINEAFQKFFRHQVRQAPTDLDSDFTQMGNDMETFRKRLHDILEKIDAKKESIEEHLKRYSKEMPFLFS